VLVCRLSTFLYIINRRGFKIEIYFFYCELNLRACKLLGWMTCFKYVRKGLMLLKQQSVYKIRHSWNDRAWQEKCANASMWSKYDKRPDVSQRRVALRNTERCLVCATCKHTSILSQADDLNGCSTTLNKKKVCYSLFSNEHVSTF